MTTMNQSNTGSLMVSLVQDLVREQPELQMTKTFIIHLSVCLSIQVARS